MKRHVGTFCAIAVALACARCSGEPSEGIAGSSSASGSVAPTPASADSGASSSSGSTVSMVSRYVGRVDSLSRMGWPGTRFVMRFHGTEAKAALVTTAGYLSGETYFDVSVDGVARATPQAAPAGTTAVTLASGLANGDHEVELVKRTEGTFGVTQVTSLAVSSGGFLTEGALPVPTRFVEMMGNSAIEGYGVDGAGPMCAASAPTHDAKKSAPYLTALDLGADLSLLGVSGKGIGANIAPSDMDTMRVLFERALPESSMPAHGFVRKPGAFVLFASNTDIALADGPLATAYADFMTRVRAVYPSTPLLLVVSAYSTDDYPVGQNARTRLVAMSNEVVRRRTMAGDGNVYAYAMTVYVEGQLTACESHPGPALHRQMATELTGWIRTRAGW